jgi:hypothetical protein
VSLRYPESLVKKNWPEPTRWIRQSSGGVFWWESCWILLFFLLVWCPWWINVYFFSFWVFRSIQIDSKMIFWKCYLKKTLFTYHLVPNSSQIGPNVGKLGSDGAKMTLWCHCWGCKPPHSASHIHNTCIWSVWAPSYAVEWHLGAPLHSYNGRGGGQILENWG